MNKYAIYHEADSKYCFPISINEVVIRLRTAKNDSIDKVEIMYNNKYIFPNKQLIKQMERKYEDQLFAYYEIKLELDDVRLGYVFLLTSKGKTYYYSEDGLTRKYNLELSYYNFFQLPYINDVDVIKEVEWAKKANFYQIFVDRFNQGDFHKDLSYINMKWGDPVKTNSFAGGDLRGIINKLGYLKDLGINAIYLTPIFKSISNHKYDISDYYQIDEMFGSLDDLKELVETAHNLNMHIVLDAVFNHCSDLLKKFVDVKEKGKESKYYSWFVIHGDKVVENPCNYETFASCTYMPKLNTSNEELQEYLLSIALYYIQVIGIDGWRLDVSDEVSHAFWKKFRIRVKKANPNALIIGENWHDAYPFLHGDEYDGIMNYSFTKAALDYFAYKTKNAKQTSEQLNHILMRNKEQINNMMFNLLDSHDTHRIYTLLDKNKEKELCALALLYIFKGIPCIYYGTEILLEGGYDPDSRRCFDWNEEHWDEDFMFQLKRIIELRNLSVLQNGDISITSENDCLIVKRYYQNEAITLIINLNKENKTFNFNGQIMIGQNYKDNQIQQNGFIIFKREGK